MNYKDIYNNWLSDVNTKNERLTDLYGAEWNTAGTKSNTMYNQVTTYVASVDAYRTYSINDAKYTTGKSFAKTLRLQDSYENWVRPLWLAYYDGYVLTAADAKDAATYTAGKVLTAAAFTYISATLAGMLQLIRLFNLVDRD